MNIVDFFFPKFCILCSKSEDYICKECIRQFVFTLPSCYVCKRLSNGYLCHMECLGKKIHVYSCWYEDRDFERVFRKQEDSTKVEIIKILEGVARERFKTDRSFLFSTKNITTKELETISKPIYCLFTPVKQRV